MDNTSIVRELLRMAKELVAIEFPTQDAMDKYLKEHPDADKSNHRVVETKKEPIQKKQEKAPKVHPKHKEMDEKEHTHNFGKLTEGDEDDTKVRVYDNGGHTADRYSVVVDGKDWKSSASEGFVPVLSLSEGGKDVSQWGDGKEGKHLGKPVKWETLSEDTRKHIEKRLKDSGS